MTKFWFTFGVGQKHENGYHTIEAETREDARSEMRRKFGMVWAIQYDSAEKAGVEKYNLHKVK